MGNRDNGGRFASQRAVPAVAVNQMAGEERKKSRKDELAEELAREQEHAELQRAGENLLNTLGPVYSATQDQLSNELYRWFKHQGFWPAEWDPQQLYNPFTDNQEDTRTVTIPFQEYVRLKKMEKLGLIVTEVAECMEAVRKDDLDNEIEELADIDVRMGDYKGGFGLTEQSLGWRHGATQGFIEKMKKNFLRPFRHGKRF